MQHHVWQMIAIVRLLLCRVIRRNLAAFFSILALAAIAAGEGNASSALPSFQVAAIVQVADTGTEVAHPTVAFDTAHNRAYVAWTTYPSEDEGVNYLAISHDGGQTFGEPVALPGRTEDHPVLRVARDGTLFTAWTHRNPDQLLNSDDPASNTTTQMVVRSTDGGKTFSIPVKVPEGTVKQAGYYMSLAVSPDGRTVTVAWFDYTPLFVTDAGPPGREAVAFYVATSHDGGHTFGAPLEVSTHVCVCCMPVGIVRDTHPTFVMRGWVAGGEAEGDLRNPWLITSSDEGDTWLPPVTVHDDGFRLAVCPHVGPGADVDRRGRLHVAWWTGAANREGYWYATSGDGVTFSTPIKLLDVIPALHGNDLSLAIDPLGTVWIAAVKLDAVVSHHAAHASSSVSSSTLALWAIPQGSTPIAIDQIAASGSLPEVAATRNGAVVVWIDGTKVMLRHVEGTQ